MAKIKRVIRPLKTEADWDAYTTISVNAYPSIVGSGEFSRHRYKERGQRVAADPIISVLGLHENDDLLGVMRLYDFSMQLHGTKLLVGGIGGVAVDLIHKKKRVAYDMVQYFLKEYYDKGAALTALYPFRPDFYKQMGYGYGRKMNQYRISPAALPSGNRQNVRPIENSDRPAFAACYQRVMDKTNGFMALPSSSFETLFASTKMQKIGYWESGQLRGYLLFNFQPVPDGNFLRNNIAIRSLIYEDAAALRGLLAFLQTQADQIETIILNTQEEDFHLLLNDPRNDSRHLLPSVYHESNTQGVGIMYRVINVPRLFELLSEHNFGGQTCTLQLNLIDSFWPACAGSWRLVAENGRIHLNQSATPDVEINMDISDFSSLVIGATTFRRLLSYGIVTISDSDYADVVHRLFFTDNKPICDLAF